MEGNGNTAPETALQRTLTPMRLEEVTGTEAHFVDEIPRGIAITMTYSAWESLGRPAILDIVTLGRSL